MESLLGTSEMANARRDQRFDLLKDLGLGQGL
jgi:hypothetical protein